MALIRCGYCNVPINSALPVCLACGRCPGCGRMRLDSAALAPDCAECGAPHCIGCGRCHECGETFELGLDPCVCGHPNDSDTLRSIEEAFAFKPDRGGCLRTATVILVVCLSVLSITARI